MDLPVGIICFSDYPTFTLFLQFCATRNFDVLDGTLGPLYLVAFFLSSDFDQADAVVDQHNLNCWVIELPIVQELH